MLCDSVRDSFPAVFLFRRLHWSWLRPAGAVYLLSFLAAVAISPHRHVNGIEDLLSDGPSDSGTFFHSKAPLDPMAGPLLSSALFVDDDRCLACFHNDWATEAIAAVALSPNFKPVRAAAHINAALAAHPFPRSGQSRAPPALS